MRYTQIPGVPASEDSSRPRQAVKPPRQPRSASSRSLHHSWLPAGPALSSEPRDTTQILTAANPGTSRQAPIHYHTDLIPPRSKPLRTPAKQTPSPRAQLQDTSQHALALDPCRHTQAGHCYTSKSMRAAARVGDHHSSHVAFLMASREECRCASPVGSRHREGL